MLRESKIALAAMFILGAASVSLAQDIRLPKVDLQKLCKQNDMVVNSTFSDVSKDYVSTCVVDEQGARDEIVKEWATFPPGARSRCIQPTDYYRGYVEWLTCLQMTRDVLKLQTGNAADAAATSSKGRRTRRQMPNPADRP